MNRPSAFTYLVGNPLSCLALLCLAGAMVYQWWINQETTSWFILIIAFVIASTAMKANTQIANYKAWKQEYDDIATGGDSSLAGARRNAFLRRFAAVIIWLALAYWLGLNAKAADKISSYGNIALVFLILTTAVLLKIIFSVWSARHKKPKQTTSDHVVTLCLPIPKESPTMQEVFPILPAYCQRLFRFKR